MKFRYMFAAYVVGWLLGAGFGVAVTAPEAHADANSYLQYIQDHHVGVGISNPSKQLWMGNTVCQELHQGMTPDQVISTSGNWLFDMPGIIGAAQHELCPDTLGHVAPAAYHPKANGPSYCYSTGEWLPFPDFSGYCPDGESPFNGPGPAYGGGNHRWPGGDDD